MLLDADRNPCAMAHLVIQSGGAQLIAALASTNNELQFGDVRDGALYEWILRSGLTRQETAFVQMPDFHVDRRAPNADAMQAAELERLHTHFLAAAAQLEMTMDAGIERALVALGDHILHAPTEA